MTQAYREGYQAYREQKGDGPYPNNGKAQNPYTNQYSSDYYDWIKGWDDRGLEDELEEQYSQSYYES